MPKELVSFDKVLPALKADLTKKAQRTGWAATQHYIQASKDGSGKLGLISSLNGISGAASLHNLDILADDWEVFQ